MSDQNPQQGIQLPPVVKFMLPTQHAMTIIQALEAHGPYREVQPVISNLQQQLLSQQVRQPVPAASPPAAGLAGASLPLQTDESKETRPPVSMQPAEDVVAPLFPPDDIAEVDLNHTVDVDGG